MKAISLQAPRLLDERQNKISSQAYRTAFHILMICIWLTFLGYMVVFIFNKNSLAGLFTNISPPLIIWPLSMIQALPMAVMAWTEPD